MEPFIQLEGRIASLPAADIDTDVIMPKQFLKGIDRSGLDEGVFHDLRFLPNGQENPAFILNQDRWRGSLFLTVGPNFGCGSSREHAVWGLRQLGIRAIFATSFAGIFYDNCSRNGLLAGIVDEDGSAQLQQVAVTAAANTIVVDLQKKRVLLPENAIVAFDIPEPSRKRLLQGLDIVGETLSFATEIDTFERHHLADSPWLEFADRSPPNLRRQF